ncbi:MAG TPA: phosphopantothenoylcysteine decarboxylase [Verrucomicrobiae bacterium]
MRCIVTAGPTHEPLDNVRRLTNLSTGRLGSELAHYLTERGHDVTLLIGQQATYRGAYRAAHIGTFGTTASLREHLKTMSQSSIDAVFHAAAVSDFAFGKIWSRSTDGRLAEVHAGKLTTRHGTLLAELIPTPKIISELRDWFPRAVLVGWKYEVDGDRAGVLQLAQRQISDCRTNACVANGRAYGPGFGLVTPDSDCLDLPAPAALYEALGRLLMPQA